MLWIIDRIYGSVFIPPMLRTKSHREDRSSFLRRMARFLRRMVLRFALFACLIALVWIAAYRVLPPPTTYYMIQESNRLNSIAQQWVPLEHISPHMTHAIVAAEDANFCTHWGLDFGALNAALRGGARRGGSTISQQTVKNAYLWQGRSWVRKGIEMAVTHVANLMWGKRRTLEIYLNIIEFDEGVFGIEAAAQHHFGVSAAKLNRTQSARLAAVLRSPKRYSAVAPSPYLRKRATAILPGADSIKEDGRNRCFEG